MSTQTSRANPHGYWHSGLRQVCADARADHKHAPRRPPRRRGAAGQVCRSAGLRKQKHAQTQTWISVSTEGAEGTTGRRRPLAHVVLTCPVSAVAALLRAPARAALDPARPR